MFAVKGNKTSLWRDSILMDYECIVLNTVNNRENKDLLRDSILMDYECIVLNTVNNRAQCPRTDLGKRFLPKPMTTTGWKGTP